MSCSSSLFVPTAFLFNSEKKQSGIQMIVSSTMSRSRTLCRFRHNDIVYPIETINHHSSFYQFSSSSLVNFSSFSSCLSFPSKVSPKTPSVFLPFCFSPDKNIYSDLFWYDEEYEYIKESDLSVLLHEKDLCLQYTISCFPFKVKITDIPDKAAIILEREYGGESIQGVLEWDEKDVAWDHNKRNFCLALTVVKEGGPRLEIFCTLTRDIFELVVIDRLLITVPEESYGQNISYELDLDEDLVRAFRIYLDKRGIGQCFEGEIRPYMVTIREVYLKKLIEKEVLRSDISI